MDNEDWKKLALKRKSANKAQKNRIKEIRSSRDTWREKYFTGKKENDLLKKQIATIKKKLNQINES